MESQFYVGRGSRTTTEQGYEATSPATPNGPIRPWQFVSEFRDLAGNESEPDPLFFVETWTFGKAAALENLRRRRNRWPAHQDAGGARGTRSLSPLSFIESDPEGEMDLDFVSSSSGATEPDSYVASLPQSSEEEVPAYPEPAFAKIDAVEDLDWKTLDQDFAAVGNALEPMTEARACRILGVNASSTRIQLKAAYRHKVSEWHPDHLQRRTEQERQLATRQMAVLNEAYHLLCSEILRETA